MKHNLRPKSTQHLQNNVCAYDEHSINIKTIGWKDSLKTQKKKFSSVNKVTNTKWRFLIFDSLKTKHTVENNCVISLLYISKDVVNWNMYN